MKKTFIVLISVLALAAPGQAQHFPAFETVLTQLFARNRIPSQLSFELQKRPEGYFLQWRNENAYPVEYLGARQLFWDARKRSWNAVQLPKTYSAANLPVLDDADAAQKARYYILEKSFESEAMDRFPFYGYTGWYEDVIRMLDKKCPKCSDEEMFGLGYAYSRAAQALLNNNQSWADSSKMFPLPHRQPALTAEQTDQYRQLALKGAAWYDRLQARTPGYRTRVGSITLKRDNEYMDIFLTLWYYQNLETAMTVLPQRKLYDPWLLETARAVLNSCPQDAILVAYGDSDTYTLLYVQAAERLRPDVVVVNSSLLQTPRYCAAVAKGMFPGSKPLPVSFPEVFYERSTIAISGDGPLYRSANDLLENMKKGPLEDIFYGITQMQVDHASFERLQLPPAPAAASFSQKAVPESFWGTEMYFAGGELLLPLAVIVQGQWQRPLCYALTSGDAVLAPWEGHLVQEGRVYRIYPDSVAANAVHIPSSRSLWNAVALDTTPFRFPEDYQPFYYAMVQAGVRWSQAERSEHGPEAARRAAQRVLQCFPAAQHARDGFWIPLVDILAEAGASDQAKQLGREIFNNLPDRASSDREWQKAQLQEIAEKYGWPPF